MGSRGQSSKKQSLGIGTKGKAKTLEEAMSTTNPNYRKGEEYRNNCQRCVYSYEMNRRGYDVEARPKIMTGTDEPASHWREGMEDQTWENMPSRNTISKMLEKMNEYGDGARAIVYVVWKGGKSAHVFIAEQEGIGTIFLDPQTGMYVDIDQYMGAAIKGRTMISRIDNLKPNKQWIRHFMQRRHTNG